MLKLKLFASVWTPTYTFDLEPVPLEKVDILESKLRDQEEELTKLRSQKSVSKQSIYLHTTCVKPVKTNTVVKWRSGGNHFKIDHSGTIAVLVSGVYMIHVVLCHSSTNKNGEIFCLIKGDQSVGSCYDSGGSNGCCTSSPLIVMLELKAHEKLSVLFKGNGKTSPASYLTAFYCASGYRFGASI